MRARLAVVVSHPVQYHAPLFRELARRLDLCVFFAHRASPEDQARAGFGVRFDWDVDLLQGYEHRFMTNVAKTPSLDTFGGCDAPEVGSLLAGGAFDAVLLMGWRLKADVQAAVAAKRLGLPVLVRGDSQLVTHRAMAKRLVKALAYPLLLRVYDAALYVGRRSKAYWTHYGYPSDRLFFSPHCVDSAWFGARATSQARSTLRGRLGIAPDRPVALFAGKLLPFKRPLDLIAAAEALKRRKREVSVLVAGAGPLEGAMTAAARAAGLDYHPLGFCNQSLMPQVYAAADVLVLPSDGGETWGLVANEALACGRPIVLSQDVGSAPDLAADGSAGRVFRTGDPDALADALMSVVAQPPSQAAIAERSGAYSLAAAVDGIEDALERVRRRGQGWSR